MKKVLIVLILLTLFYTEMIIPSNASIDYDSLYTLSNITKNQNKVRFTDVKEDDWFYSYIEKSVEKGFISGYPDGSFRPNDKITDAEFLALLIKSMGYKVDPAPKEEYWAYNYNLKAKELGIIEKNQNYLGWFDTTRGEAAELLVKADKDWHYPEDLQDYSKQIDSYRTMYYKEYILKAYVSGLFSGYGNEYGRVVIGENDTLTRAQACTVILKFLDKSRTTPQKVEQPKWIEPNFAVIKPNIYHYGVFSLQVTNWKEYDFDVFYNCKVECLNYPEFNTYWAGSPFTGERFLMRRDEWIKFSSRRLNGEFYLVSSLPADEDGNIIVPKDVTLDLKITFEKDDLSKEYFISIPLSEYIK